MKSDEIITELVSLILMQEKELTELREKLERVNKYIEVYEQLIRGE